MSNKESRNWHLLDGDEVIRELHTNASLGLSGKEARSRAKKAGKNTLFSVRKKSVFSCFSVVIADPSLLLCILVSCVAACFSRFLTALTIWLIILVALIACTLINLQFERRQERSLLYTMPMARLIRDGKLCLTSAWNLVPGDLILLHQGDIVPADARLIRSVDLTVATVILDGGKPTRSQPVSKHSEALSESDSNFPPFYENMVYGMSEVLSGEAVAVVTEIGRHSFLSASGYTANPVKQRTPRSLERLKKYCNIYGIIMLISVIPLTVIGMLSSSGGDFLDYFLLSLSLAASSMSSGIVSFAKTVYRHCAEQTADPENAADALIFTDTAAIDAFRHMNEIVLVGSAALHDGKMHAVAVYAGGHVCGKEELSADIADPLLCAAYQSFSGCFAAPGEGLAPNDETFSRCYEGLRDLLRLAGTDLDTVRRISGPPRYQNDGIPGEFGSVTVRTGKGEVTYHLSSDENCVRRCTSMRDGNTLFPMSPFSATSAVSAATVYRRKCCRVFYLYTDTPDGESIFEGFLAFSPAPATNLSQVLNQFSTYGIGLTLFIDRQSDSRYFASLAGFSEEGAKEGVPCFRISDHPSDDALLYTQQLQQQGKRVCVFSVESESLSLLKTADMAVGCDTIRYDTDGFSDRYFIGLAPEGQADSDRSSQLTRIASDLLIHRSARSHGGLHSLLTAFETSVSASLHMKAMIQYLVCSQFLRAVLVLAELFAGVHVVSAPIVLLFGLFFDLFAVLLIAYSRPMKLPPKHPCPRFFFYAIASVMTGIALFFLSMIPEYIGQTDALSGQGGFLFLSVFLTQVVIFLFVYLLYCGKFRINALTGGLLLFFCTIIVRGVTLEPIADFLGIGGMNLFRCAFLPCAPALFLLLSILLTGIFFRHRKE